MAYGLGATIALPAPAPLARVPVVRGVSLSTPNATPWGTLKPSINVARPISFPVLKMPVLIAPKAPAPTTVAAPVATKPSVSILSAPSPQTPSVTVPSGAATGTSLVPSSSAASPDVEVGTIDKPQLSVGLIGLGLLALFLLTKDRR